MKSSKKTAYQNLGKVIFESGIAEAFAIFPDQKIDAYNVGVRALIDFMIHNADESVVSCVEDAFFQTYNTYLH